MPESLSLSPVFSLLFVYFRVRPFCRRPAFPPLFSFFAAKEAPFIRTMSGDARNALSPIAFLYSCCVSLLLSSLYLDRGEPRGPLLLLRQL